MYQNESGVSGMAPTRALLDGVLKYKKLFREFTAPPTNHFLYDAQEGVRAFVFGGGKIPAEVGALEVGGMMIVIGMTGDGPVKLARIVGFSCSSKRTMSATFIFVVLLL